jgi:hypothetical protein
LENSFQSRGSRGSKNFVLKSDYLNNTNQSKKNSFFFESNMNNMNQKSLFKTSNSFLDQDDENERNKEKNKEKNISQHISDKEIDVHMFNNNIFNEANDNNKIKINNHSNLVQEYYKNVEENIDLLNNQFNNINISNKEINDNNNYNLNENNNINYFINKNNNSNFNNLNQNNSGMQNNYILNDLVNNSHNQSSNSINNSINQNTNYLNIIPALIEQNSINNINGFNINSFNHNSQNMYFSSQNNINNMPNVFLAKKNEENLINNCVTFCKEQLECRQLQKIIDADPSTASNVIYDKIKDKIQ